MKLHSIVFSIALSVLFTAAGAAQTSFPMVTHTTPVAVQRGKTTVVTVFGRMNFYGCYQAIFQGEGVSATIETKYPKPKSGKLPTSTSVKLKVTVAPNAPLGVREFRVVSKLGVSSVGQILIVDDPVIEEAKDNDTLAKAQKIALPQVVAARLEKLEDVDYYVFDAKRGDRLAIEVHCARLQDKIHDLQKHAKPMIVLYDADGRELASNDHFYFADPLLTYEVPKDGKYYVQVRESTYDGDGRWVYALTVTNRPYVSHVFPMAGKAGSTMQVEPVGTAREKSAAVALPQELGIHRVQLNCNGMPTNPVTVIATDLPTSNEVEPNDMPEQATTVTLPVGINGRLQQTRDLDHYKFTAKKGQAIRIEVMARRFGTDLVSSAHIVLDLLDAKGKVIQSSTDTHGQKEASLLFRPVRDGEYILRVRDLNSKGGPTAVYFVALDWARPDFQLTCDGDKAMIGPGSRTAWFVKVERRDGFDGPVTVRVDGLPKGVQCSALTIPKAMTEGLLVLSADKSAKIAASNVAVIGEATIKDENGKELRLERQAQPMQEIYMPGGGRGLFPVEMQTVAVTEASDIVEVAVTPNRITLRPGQEAKIEVTVKRHPRYGKNVSLDVLLRHLSRTYGNPLPPGVTIVSGKSKTLLGKGSKGHIVLKAAADAKPISDVPIAVLAHVSVNFVVKISYSSEPIRVSIVADGSKKK